MKNTYAIFDLDGTLIDYEGASHEAFMRVLARFNKKFSKELHSAIIGTHHDSWSRKIIDAHQLQDHITPTEFVQAYHDIIEELIPTIPMMPGAAELLRSLKANNIPVAIATSSSAKIVPKKISHHPIITECVDILVTGDDPLVRNGKPAPDIFLLAAERLGCPNNTSALKKCIVFEDSPFGVLGGLNAGMRTVALPDPRFLTEESLREHERVFSRARWRLTSLSEFSLPSSDS